MKSLPAYLLIKGSGGLIAGFVIINTVCVMIVMVFFCVSLSSVDIVKNVLVPLFFM